jgi:hypothetical protein
MMPFYYTVLVGHSHATWDEVMATIVIGTLLMYIIHIMLNGPPWSR